MKVDSKVLLCKDALKCETMDDFYGTSCYDIKCKECPLSVICSSEDLEPIKLRAKEYLEESTKTQPWTKEVVFKVYCNDNLYELPLKILEQMRDHLNNIIDSKTPLE